MTLPRLDNTTARRLFLDRHALIEPPNGGAKGDALHALIDRLGFVQIDSVNTVARAHDMILFSRRQSYRPANLPPLLEHHRKLFEHWTHDAAVIPTDYFPHWRHRFARDRDRLHTKWTKWQGPGFEAKFEAVLKRISDHGPCCSAEVGADEVRTGGGWWDWHPSKVALEYLWRTGALSVTRREGFRKFYDLTERVLPADCLTGGPSHEETINWACSAALDRLGFATSGELAAFWALVTPAEAKVWCVEALAQGRIIELDIDMANGKPRRHFARPDLPDMTAPVPGPRLRILSPFDPALRDRKRAERLFGFHYRIEIFVPEPQRRYGYYVFPVLEGDRLVGRIDMKADRASGQLQVRGFWPERHTALGAGREKRLLSELGRVARMAGCADVVFTEGWLKIDYTV